MQSTKILTIVFLYLFIQSCSSKKTDWTIDKENEMISLCIRTSDYLSKIDSLSAWNIAGCIIDQIKVDYSYESLKIKKLENDSELKILFEALFQNCTLPNLANEERIVVFNKDWFPTQAEQIMIEELLINEISKNKSKDWTNLNERTVKNYYRQYSFSLTKTGEKIVYINGFCQLLELPMESSGEIIFKPQDWKNEMIIVEDGGDCYWRIEINLTKVICNYFNVNGCA